MINWIFISSAFFFKVFGNYRECTTRFLLLNFWPILSSRYHASLIESAFQTAAKIKVPYSMIIIYFWSHTIIQINFRKSCITELWSFEFYEITKLSGTKNSKTRFYCRKAPKLHKIQNSITRWVLSKNNEIFIVVFVREWKNI